MTESGPQNASITIMADTWQDWWRKVQEADESLDDWENPAKLQRGSFDIIHFDPMYAVEDQVTRYTDVIYINLCCVLSPKEMKCWRFEK